MKPSPAMLSQGLLQQISDAIAGVRFGHVQIIIHNARIVQIEKVEKMRVDTAANPLPGSTQQQLSRDDRNAGSPRIAQGR